MNKIILADGSVVLAESVTLEPCFVIRAADRDAFLAVWDQLTPDNLEQVDIYIDDKRIAGFTSCELQSIQTLNNYDGSLIVHFYLVGFPAEPRNEYQEAFQVITGEVE